MRDVTEPPSRLRHASQDFFFFFFNLPSSFLFLFYSLPLSLCLSIHLSICFLLLLTLKLSLKPLIHNFETDKKTMTKLRPQITFRNLFTILFHLQRLLLPLAWTSRLLPLYSKETVYSNFSLAAYFTSYIHFHSSLPPSLSSLFLPFYFYLPFFPPSPSFTLFSPSVHFFSCILFIVRDCYMYAPSFFPSLSFLFIPSFIILLSFQFLIKFHRFP